jgi:hypothetical protein
VKIHHNLLICNSRAMMSACMNDERSGSDGNKHLILHCILICVYTLGPLLFALLKWVGPDREDPCFSVGVSDARGFEPTTSPLIRLEFNLTLRVDNDQDFVACREEVTVTVFYTGAVVAGWADMPDFCVAS